MQNERKKGKMKRKRGLMPCPSKGLKGILDRTACFGQVKIGFIRYIWTGPK